MTKSNTAEISLDRRKLAGQLLELRFEIVSLSTQMSGKNLASSGIQTDVVGMDLYSRMPEELREVSAQHLGVSVDASEIVCAINEIKGKTHTQSEHEFNTFAHAITVVSEIDRILNETEQLEPSCEGEINNVLVAVRQHLCDARDQYMDETALRDGMVSYHEKTFTKDGVKDRKGSIAHAAASLSAVNMMEALESTYCSHLVVLADKLIGESQDDEEVGALSMLKGRQRQIIQYLGDRNALSCESGIKPVDICAAFSATEETYVSHTNAGIKHLLDLGFLEKIRLRRWLSPKGIKAYHHFRSENN